MLLYPEKPPHWGLQGLQEENAVASPWQAGQRKTCTDSLYHSLVHPRLRRVSANVGGGWVLKHGVRRADPRRGLLLATWRQTEGKGVMSSTARNAPGGNVECLESECHCGVACKGWGCHHRLSLHMPAPSSVVTRRDSQQSEHVCPSRTCLIPLSKHAQPNHAPPLAPPT